MKLWVDDIRAAPEGWERARTVTEAIRLLRTGHVMEISLDHDICHERQKHGDELVFMTFSCDETYAAVAMYIADVPSKFRPFKVFIHTANPAGAKDMMEILEGKVPVLKRVLDYAPPGDTQ